MISLHGIQELHLLLWPHADLPSVRRVFSCSAVGGREVHLAAPHAAHCQVPQMFLSRCWTRLGHLVVQHHLKMSRCRSGKASLSRSCLQSTNCFQAKANHVINFILHSEISLHFPFCLGFMFSDTRKLLISARRRQVEVCLDALFLLGFCPQQLMGMCQHSSFWKATQTNQAQQKWCALPVLSQIILS